MKQEIDLSQSGSPPFPPIIETMKVWRYYSTRSYMNPV